MGHHDEVEVAAVIFDFDGVVVESTDIKTQAFVDLFPDHPEHHEAIVRYHRQYFGMSRYKKFAWIYSELLKQPLTQTRLKELGQEYSELVFDKVLAVPYVPGATECLTRLRQLGIPAFVASGTPQEELRRIIALRGLGPFFKEVWGTPNEKNSVIRSIRSSYRLRSERMLFVGDGFFDFHAAHGEGIPFLARDSGAEDVDWDKLGIPVMNDLVPLAQLAFDMPVRIPPFKNGKPQMILSIHRQHV